MSRRAATRLVWSRAPFFPLFNRVPLSARLCSLLRPYRLLEALTMLVRCPASPPVGPPPWPPFSAAARSETSRRVSACAIAPAIARAYCGGLRQTRRGEVLQRLRRLRDDQPAAPPPAHQSPPLSSMLTLDALACDRTCRKPSSNRQNSSRKCVPRAERENLRLETDPGTPSQVLDGAFPRGSPATISVRILISALLSPEQPSRSSSPMPTLTAPTRESYAPPVPVRSPPAPNPDSSPPAETASHGQLARRPRLAQPRQVGLHRVPLRPRHVSAAFDRRKPDPTPL